MGKIIFVGKYAYSKEDFDEIFAIPKKTYTTLEIQKMSEKEKAGFQLRWTLISYLGGIRPSTSLGDALWGIVDPLYGMYRVTTRKEREDQFATTSEENKIVIEDLYSRYPIVVRAYLKGVVGRLEKKQKEPRDIVIRKRVLSLLDSISVKCPKCEESIPKKVKNCPYCNEKIPEKSHEQEQDPLRILKLRYAKGELTKEEYEDIKRTLES